MTLNPKILVFSEFFAISSCDIHFKSELRRNHSRAKCGIATLSYNVYPSVSLSVTYTHCVSEKSVIPFYICDNFVKCHPILPLRKLCKQQLNDFQCVSCFLDLFLCFNVLKSFYNFSQYGFQCNLLLLLLFCIRFYRMNVFINFIKSARCDSARNTIVNINERIARCSLRQSGRLHELVGRSCLQPAASANQ